MNARADQLPENVELGVLGKAMLDAAQAAHLGVSVTVLEPTGPRLIYLNDAAAKITGCDAQAALQEDPLSQVAPEDLPKVQERLRQRMAGEPGQASYEISIARRDGRRTHVEVTATDATIDGRRFIFSFIVDITARKQAEAARLRSEARFRELIEIAPEPIGIVRDARMVYCNGAFVRVLGYPSAQEIYELPLSRLVHPEEADLVESRARRIADDEDRFAPYAYRAIRRDGSMVLLEVSSVPFDYEGRPAVLTMGRDVTSRKMLEAQLVQADRLAALGTMAAGVAHEINNPLGYLVLNLDWIARQLRERPTDPSSRDALLAMLQEARGGAERVAAIVRELRSFSRADGDTRRNVDLGTVVRSAIKMVSHEVRYRARVTTTLEPVHPVWANQARLEQVVLNLLLNSAQSMPEARLDTNEIRVELRPDGDGRAVLEVSDNGSGISPEVLPRIFDPFFTTKPNGLGTGLGLSICHGIVASLGGQITVHSELGAGTTFRVLLPMTQADAADVDGEDGETPRAASPVRARVLVIDDELQIANTMRDLLGTDNDVVATTSAREALEAIRSGLPFDVAFCDLMMPGMSGIEFFEQVRQKHPGFERKIVFMTGGAFTPRAAEFLASVENQRVEKPFSLALVERIVGDMAAAR